MKKTISKLLVLVLLFNFFTLGNIIKADDYTNNSNKLGIENIEISNQEKIHIEDKLNIGFKLNNNSESKIEDLEFSLGQESSEYFSILNSKEDLTLSTIESKQSKLLNLELGLNEKALEGTYNIELNIGYKYKEEELTQKFYFQIKIGNIQKEAEKGKEETDSNNSNIQLAGGGPSLPPNVDNNNSSGGGGGNSSTTSVGKPKLIVDNYSVNPNPIRAGEEFDLTVSFYNTNKSKSVRNIKIMLNSSGSSANTGGTAGTEGNAPSVSGSIFIPLGSSNTFFIDSIGPGRRVSKTIRLTTPYGVSPNIYELNVKLEYEDSQGNEFESTESLGINLFQEAKIQVGTIAFGDPSMGGIVVGGDTPFSVDLYNTGRSPVYNFMIKVKGGFEVDGDTLYIGTFQPGSTENFSSNIRVLNEGDVNGSLFITYEDSTGQTHELTQEFSGTAINMEPEIDPNLPIEDNNGVGFLKSPKILIGLLALIILIVILILFLKKKRNKKSGGLSVDDELEIKLEDKGKNTDIETVNKGNKDENN